MFALCNLERRILGQTFHVTKLAGSCESRVTEEAWSGCWSDGPRGGTSGGAGSGGESISGSGIMKNPNPHFIP
ncbi:unnamed protein product [Nesidiocoris tenuis]|uniref:Uncharacterized protein n=1 Tax=Nesidiocoris tenuis TaxID=355587 RepID=A0A6H5G0E6_9HEMI|nr:unnamed protein product [Nesidiocoris tenuis]